MNRILSTLLSTALIINLLGCTSSPSNKEVSKLALKTDEITDVKLLNMKENNTVKAETNNKGFIVQMLKSLQAGTPKEVSLTKQTMESVSCKMEIVYEDQSIKTLLILVNDEDTITIMENSNATSTKGVQIQHDLKTPMIVLNFIKQ
ncbi:MULTISPECIES: hypothetical protein [Bacillus cereus group]|uniref:Lipoprotein n=2 Tax=Bacillus cereus group TaxID=86661 RepID=A0A2C1D2H8_BACCE|nr:MULTISPECIES: hypothetical protein [Bacillus cereus group]OFD80190.1 hypothetical protein BWGOE9_21290 [Bacillus mycoides]OFD80756.1 hypothetical protein BWGOE8_21240 [Bacillus mycoides]OFD83475.1 hypothetical protein BWGOE10_21420 [Bacillus mycoides]PGS94611.1 hypothetical protein COD09_24035 [Bacillus cereus]